MQTIPASPQTKRQGGYTIVEVSIALAIIGILLVAGLSGANSLLLSSKANTQIEESSRAMAKLQSNLSSTNVTSLTTVSAIGMGLFPSSRASVSGSGTSATGTVLTAMGGGNEFVLSNAALLDTGTHNITLAIGGGVIYTLTNIPKGACSEIAASLASFANAAYVYSATTTPTESTAGSNTGLLKDNQIKAPGAAVQGTKLGALCNSADLVHLAFILRS